MQRVKAEPKYKQLNTESKNTEVLSVGIIFVHCVYFAWISIFMAFAPILDVYYLQVLSTCTHISFTV